MKADVGNKFKYIIKLKPKPKLCAQYLTTVNILSESVLGKVN